MLKPDWHRFPVGQKVECIERYGDKVETDHGWFGPLKLVHGAYLHLPQKGERFTVKTVEEPPMLRPLPGLKLNFHEIEPIFNPFDNEHFGFWSIYFAPVIRMKRPT